MLEIVKKYKENVRRTHEEPAIEIYSQDYYKSQCSGHEIFNYSGGQELDLIRQKVLSLCSLKPEDSALDVGCGRGELVRSLADLGLRYVVGIDLSEDSINISQATCARQIKTGQVAIQKMSATQLQLDRDLFDVVYMTDVVEHLSDTNLKQAISEAYRVLKPGGSLIIHTLPTVNYKLYGQYLIKYYFRLKGLEWWTPTSQEEAIFAGHVNIQSKTSLEYYLFQDFPVRNIEVFYAPASSSSILKKLVGRFGLWTILSPHLWAIATK